MCPHLPFRQMISSSTLAVGLAEMGDKDPAYCYPGRAIIASAASHWSHAGLSPGGWICHTGGLVATNVIPASLVQIVSGLVFQEFGILIRDGGRRVVEPASPCRGHLRLFHDLLRMGDKTQIASGPFATEYDPQMVLIGVMAALFILSAMAVFLGRSYPGSCLTAG